EPLPAVDRPREPEVAARLPEAAAARPPVRAGTVTALAQAPADVPAGLVARERPPAPPVEVAALGDTVRTGAGERRRLALADGSVLYFNQNTAARVLAERQVALEKGEVYVEVAPRPQEGKPATFVVKTPGRDVTALGTKFTVKAEQAGTGVVVTQSQVE